MLRMGTRPAGVRRVGARSAGAIALAALLASAGCGGDDGVVVEMLPGGVPAVASSAEAAVSPVAQRARAERAKKLFIAECAACHGEKGRGDGPAAAVLAVPPRDFTSERFKFRSTPSGEPPRRQDILDTITKGLPGSGMPAFGFLSQEERELLVDHVRGLAGIAGEPDPEAVALGTEPPADAASIARGRKVYEEQRCDLCHGLEGRGDGPSAKMLKDEKERPIAARDLTGGVFRRGESAAELHMRFRTGLDGTPMPSYRVSEQEGWDLAHYVESLRRPAPPAPADPVARGRAVLEAKSCRACHTIEGKGGTAAPSLDVAAAKLRYDWVREFLANPRPFGKIYPWIPYRMPHLGLTKDEVEGVVALFGALAGRPVRDDGPAPAIPAEKVDAGKLIYVLKCAECHNLGDVIPLYEAKRQGPDLIQVADRVRHDWFPKWVADPHAIVPGTRMVKTNLSPEEIDQVRAFLWKLSTERRKP